MKKKKDVEEIDVNIDTPGAVQVLRMKKGVFLLYKIEMKESMDEGSGSSIEEVDVDKGLQTIRFQLNKLNRELLLQQQNLFD